MKLDFCGFPSPVAAPNAQPYPVPVGGHFPTGKDIQGGFQATTGGGRYKNCTEHFAGFNLPYIQCLSVRIRKISQLRFFGLSYPSFEMPEIAATTEI